MSFPVLTGSEGAKWEMKLRGDSQSANISAHKVRLHVIIRFRTQGNKIKCEVTPSMHMLLAYLASSSATHPP